MLNEQDELHAAVERLNAGEPIAPVEASLLGRTWEVARSTAARQRSMGLQLGAVAGSDGQLAPVDADQRIAITARYQLLDELIKSSVLAGYMEDAKLRQKMFAAVASLPCNKNDLGEALFLKRLRESSPELAEQAREEARQAGYDPDHPDLAGRLIAWIQEQR